MAKARDREVVAQFISSDDTWSWRVQRNVNACNERTNGGGRRNETTLVGVEWSGVERISLISLACGVFGPNADSLASSEAATAREGKRESGGERGREGTARAAPV